MTDFATIAAIVLMGLFLVVFLLTHEEDWCCSAVDD